MCIGSRRARNIKKRSIEAEVRPAAGMMALPTLPNARTSYSNEKEVFAAQEYESSKDCVTEEDKDISLLPRRCLGDDNAFFSI